MVEVDGSLEVLFDAAAGGVHGTQVVLRRSVPLKKKNGRIEGARDETHRETGEAGRRAGRRRKTQGTRLDILIPKALPPPYCGTPPTVVRTCSAARAQS